jgi:hypothetical protein
MHRPCRVAMNVVMEVLESGERCPPDSRRNTSKGFFESLTSGNKAATCCLFVAAFSHYSGSRGNKPATCCHFGTIQLQ